MNARSWGKETQNLNLNFIVFYFWESYRFDKLELLPLLDLLYEADVLEAGADEIPLLHLQGGIGLKVKEGEFKFYDCSLNTFLREM